MTNPIASGDPGWPSAESAPEDAEPGGGAGIGADSSGIIYPAQRAADDTDPVSCHTDR